jgi:hypothetical protein
MQADKTTTERPRGGRPFGSKTKPKPLHPNALLCQRTHTAMLLGGVSISYVKRLEKAGVLDVVKPNPNGGLALNKVVQVRQLAAGRTDRVTLGGRDHV